MDRMSSGCGVPIIRKSFTVNPESMQRRDGKKWLFSGCRTVEAVDAKRSAIFLPALLTFLLGISNEEVLLSVSKTIPYHR